jgi:hypothetical protein
MGRFLPIPNLTRDRLLLGEKRPFTIYTCRAFNKNNLARHQVVLYLKHCARAGPAGYMRDWFRRTIRLLTMWLSVQIRTFDSVMRNGCVSGSTSNFFDISPSGTASLQSELVARG